MAYPNGKAPWESTKPHAKLKAVGNLLLTAFLFA
jgi:hypothetical protein